MYGVIIIVLLKFLGITLAFEMTLDKNFVGIRFSPYSKFLDDRRNYTMEEVESMLQVVSTRFTNIYINDMGTTEQNQSWSQGEATGFTPVAAANLNKRDGKLSLKVNIGCSGTVERILPQEIDNAINAANEANLLYNGTVTHIGIHLRYESQTFWPNSTEPFLHMRNLLNSKGRSYKYKLGVICYECGGILEQSTEEIINSMLSELIGIVDYIIFSHFPITSITIYQSAEKMKTKLLNLKENLLKQNPSLEVFTITGWPTKVQGAAVAALGSRNNAREYLSLISNWAGEAQFKIYIHASFDEPWRDFNYGWWTRIQNDTGGNDYFVEKYSRQEKMDDDINEEIRFLNAEASAIPSVFRNNSFFGVLFNLDAPSFNIEDVHAYTLKVQVVMLELVATRFKKITTLVMGGPGDTWDENPYGYAAIAAATVNRRKGFLALELNLGCLIPLETPVEIEINNAIEASIEANKIFNDTVKQITVSVRLDGPTSPTIEVLSNLTQVFTFMKPLVNQNKLKLGIRTNACFGIAKLRQNENYLLEKNLLEAVGLADFLICRHYYPQWLSSEPTRRRLGEQFLQLRDIMTKVYPELEVIAETGFRQWNMHTKSDYLKDLVDLWSHMANWANKNHFQVYMTDAFDQSMRLSGWWRRSTNASLCCTTFEEKIIHLGPFAANSTRDRLIVSPSKHIDTNLIGVQFYPYTPPHKSFGDYTVEETEQMLELVSSRFCKVLTVYMGIHGAKTALAAANVNQRNGRKLLEVSTGCHGEDADMMEEEFKYGLDAAQFANEVFNGTVSGVHLLIEGSNVHTNFLAEQLPVWKQLTKQKQLEIGIRTLKCEDFADELTSLPINTSIQRIIDQLDFLICIPLFFSAPVETTETVENLIKQFGAGLLNMRQTFRKINPKIKIFSDTTSMVPEKLQNSTNLWSRIVSWSKQNKFPVYLNGAFDLPGSTGIERNDSGWWETRTDENGDLYFVEKNQNVDNGLEMIEAEIVQLNLPIFSSSHFGVNFLPFTKFHSWAWDYSINEIDNMLELVSTKFTRIASPASKIYESGIHRKVSRAIQDIPIAASNINFRSDDLALTVSLVIDYVENVTVLKQQIFTAMEVALIANNNFNGTVTHIIVELKSSKEADVRNSYNSINPVYSKATLLHLKVGLYTHECEDLSQLRENVYIKELLALVNIIICFTLPTPSPSVKASADKLQSQLMNWRASLTAVNSQLIVACYTGWPSKYVNQNGTEGSIASLVEFWLNMNHWADNNKFLTYMNQAFDQPMFEKDASANQTGFSQSLRKSDAHYGWWLRTKNHTSLPEAFVQKIKLLGANSSLEMGHIIGTNWWIWVSLSVTIVTISLLVLTFYKYRQIRSQLLTDAEIKEFELGTASGSGGYEMEDGLSVPYDKKFEIPYNHIHPDHRCILGGGTFGIVYKGNVDSFPEDVALKMTKENSSARNLKSILFDAKIMIHVGQHMNVVRIIGACTEKLRVGEVITVTELCENGSLEQFLRSRKNFEYQNLPMKLPDSVSYPASVSMWSPIQKLNKWAYEIACGMEYISSRKVIHADLATRNVLLTRDETAKITDFGLSRRLYEYTEYVKKSQEPLPWRWMALESLQNMTFSTQSDVWSFAVTLWEIFTIGVIPYPGKHWDIGFTVELENGFRLNKPELASSDIYKIMMACWKYDPKSRPSFTELSDFLRKIMLEDTSHVYTELYLKC